MKNNYNNPKKFIEFCEAVNSNITQKIKTVYVTCAYVLKISYVNHNFCKCKYKNFSNGIDMSGLYVAYVLLRHQINFDQQCDICSAVRRMRRLNENFFKDKVSINWKFFNLFYSHLYF